MTVQATPRGPAIPRSTATTSATSPSPAGHRPLCLAERALRLPRAHIVHLARTNMASASEAQIEAFVTGLLSRLHERVTAQAHADVGADVIVAE